jgi:hypothetical protein
MSWDRNNPPTQPSTKPDCVHKDAKYWFKEMISVNSSCVSPLLECPLTGKLMVGRVGSGWYYISEVVQKEFEIWNFESIVLGI